MRNKASVQGHPCPIQLYTASHGLVALHSKKKHLLITDTSFNVVAPSAQASPRADPCLVYSETSLLAESHSLHHITEIKSE
eukprot:m.454011 g.454011  ORF g.454011 m.454011 type:complete len:81 (-) comp20597_c0_seq1:29-271(-)